jgi:hypothetical protein
MQRATLLKDSGRSLSSPDKWQDDSDRILSPKPAAPSCRAAEDSRATLNGQEETRGMRKLIL